MENVYEPMANWTIATTEDLIVITPVPTHLSSADRQGIKIYIDVMLVRIFYNTETMIFATKFNICLFV